ncbi:hypothetical protein HDU79_006463 [Rhizoclosmatium sp. JEL0117]|nr:hypothetical protein HDU79_006463 [Rhizoclosmatium sp. JEL0117]
MSETSVEETSGSTSHLPIHELSIEHISFTKQPSLHQDQPHDPSSTSQSHPPTSSHTHEPGLSHWESTRREWTKGHAPYSETGDCQRDYKAHPSVSKVHPSQFNDVYENLVNGRRFQKPVPLTFITAVLISGWKKEGLWCERPPEPIEKPIKREDSDNEV